MNDVPWVITGIIAGLVLVGILLVLMLRKRKKEGIPEVSNYRSFLILGASFVPVGIIYEIVFFIKGTTVFLALGIAFIVAATILAYAVFTNIVRSRH